MRLALSALLAGLCLGACVPEHPWPEAARDPEVAAQAKLDSLRAEGRWAEALELAAQRAATDAHRPGVPAWRRRDAARELATLQTIDALPDSDRAALALARRQLRAGGQLLARTELAAAEPLVEAAWRTSARILGPRHVETLAASVELARIEFRSGHVALLDQLTRVAAPGLRVTLGPDHPLVADAEEVRGLQIKSFADARGRMAALPHYDAALHALVTSTGPSTNRVADLDTRLANLLRLDATQPVAMTAALFAQALEVRRSNPDADGAEVASTLGSLGTLYAQEERWADAERPLREAVEFARRHPGVVDMMDFSFSLGTHGMALRHLGNVAGAIAELREAVVLRESLWARTGADEGRSLMVSLTSYRELAAALAASGQGGEALVALERGNSRLLAERLLGAEARSGDPWRDVLARIQRVLPENSALVCWAFNPMRLRRAGAPVWACVVRRHGPPRWHALSLSKWGAARPLASRERLLRELRGSAEWPVRAPVAADVRRICQQCEQEWFAPLVPDLAGATEIIVAQPEQLVAFEALMDEHGRWLDERYRISYAPSGLLYAWARERAGAGRPIAARGALLVGDPDYGTGTEELPALRESRAEIAGIAARFPAATILTGDAASCARLRAMAASGELAHYGLLHFATHCEANVEEPLRAALVFAATPSRDPESSRLRASEIMDHWRLDADIVSLASCRSSAGMSGPTDGPFGLPQAFLTAGARSLLVSLWPVDDEATSLLMRRFYDNLAKPGATSSRSEALREARAWLRNWRAANGSRPFAHPSYWAAFVLIGDPG